MATPKPPKPDTPPVFDDATEQELRDAAEITPDDVTRAGQAWRSDARPAFRSLLDATAEDTPAE